MTLATPAAPVNEALPSAPSISTVPIAEIARRRFSSRAYLPGPIASEQRSLLDSLVTSVRGPFGAAVRFRVVAATEQDAEALRGLGTYGFIKGARAFVVGAVGPGEKQLEDYGYAMERVVLGATAIGLGTCWLGGSFTRSRFARAIGATATETVPAVIAVGHSAPGSEDGRIRRRVSGHRRKPWSELFFDGDFGAALTPERAGPLATAVETLRLAPSASNKQPWRVVRQGSAWHFYLERTPGYGPGTLTSWLLRLADLQRVDMGIAMCHFELAAREAGQAGQWVVQPPKIEQTGAAREYVVTWVEGREA
ncbi:MAG: nitroreductase family protein [Anaeromyxobacteraceae bacterium]